MKLKIFVVVLLFSVSVFGVVVDVPRVPLSQFIDG